MPENLTYRGELVVETCWCGIVHAIPKQLRNLQKRQHNNGQTQQGIFCPAGHRWFYSGTGEAEKQRQRAEAAEETLARERAQHDQTRAELRDTELRRRAEKGQKTRIKNRVANGVCPCCNRTFQDLQRHMQTKHPEFSAPE